MHSHHSRLLRLRADRDIRPLPDWSKLARNDTVSVLRRDGSVAAGRIDMINVDRTIFWLIQNDGRGRIMICHDDSPSVLKTDQNL
ncbi:MULTISPECIES: hypothetical protein [Arthrobacter]|uniref:Uncharacterized protein n=1 Tax=Arthrobacter terricola TaxID=2547396 RepID=A0A4V2ZRW1_9MICC|nr:MULTISPECIES: hypothetical protein [Arthrobacter]MBT8163614.1 hypothetical protein [Arthrobacter sp. GN70]TDF88552.1 hypothetical protein E1809_23855 [Arthrobacter terricola]